jgi:SPX domain protein involved in polyphosphate accumulation
MPQDHRLQQQRFELKYLVPEALTHPMRDFVGSYLELDDFAAGQPGLSYPIHSVYLDSDDLQTHRATLNGIKNRFKLRMRYYDDRPDTPVFFEVKAREDNCILKQRCGVRREAVPLVLAGQSPAPELLLSREPRHLAALERFSFLAQQLQARPKLHNAYLREAWVSAHDNSVRLTFDRNIRAEPFFSHRTVVEMTRPSRFMEEFVVLELKFTTRFPNWFKTLVERFDLMQSSCAKYSGVVQLLGEDRFLNNRWCRPRAGLPVAANDTWL